VGALALLLSLYLCWFLLFLTRVSFAYVKVAASTNKEVEGHIPNYPNLPAQLICQLHDVTMHVRGSLP
jgi:hypothetical protein